MTSEKKKPVYRSEPDNSKLYKKTRLLFKNREKNRKAAEKRRKEKPPPIKNFIPRNRFFCVPKSFTANDIYRPPTYLEYASEVSSPSNRRRTSRAIKCRPDTGGASSSQAHVKWPPPKDSNYFKSSCAEPKQAVFRSSSSDPPPVDHSSVSNLKFVHCSLCGKKNLSSASQLRKHQESSACEKRRVIDLQCKVCRKTFDNKHNLRFHVCRLN